MSAVTAGQDDHPSVQDNGLKTYLPFLFGQVYLRRSRALGDVLRDTGLTENEFRVLVVLDAHDCCRMGQLSDWTVIDRSTLSRTLSQMEQKGLARRVMPPKDRRAVEVYMTPNGRELYREGNVLTEALNNRMLNGLSPVEIDTLKTTLRKLVVNLGAGAVLSGKEE